MKMKVANKIKGSWGNFWSQPRRRQQVQGAGAALLGLGVIVGLLVWLRPAKASTEQSIITTEIQLANCPATGTSTNLLQTCSNNTSSYSSSMRTGRYGMVYWQPGLYGGDVKVYLEVVGNSSIGSSTSTFGLFDVTAGGANAISGTEITTTSTSLTRVRSGDLASILKGLAGHNLSVVHKNSAGTSSLQAAKLIVIQSFPSGQLSSTAHYIELGSNKSKSITANSYTDVEDGELFTYDASKYDGSLRFYLDVTTNETTGVTENIILIDATTNQTVPMVSASNGGCTPDPSALCWLGPGDTRLRGQITGGLISGHNYKLQTKVTANNQRITLAHLIIVQTPVIDQEQTDNSTTFTLDGTGTSLAARAVAQQFQVSNSNYYSGVSIQANKVASPADNLKVTIRTDFDGTIVGDPLYLPVTSVGSTLSTFNLFFTRPLWLTGHTTYILEVERTGAADATNYFQIGQSGADGSYTGGSAYFYGFSTWASGPFFSANDIAFQIFTYQLPSRFETYQQLANSGQNTSSSSYQPQFQYGIYKDTESGTITEFARTANTVYFEATMKAIGGTASAQLSDGTGTVSTSSATYVNARTAFSPATDTQLDVQIKNTSGSVVIAKGALVIDVVIAPTITAIAPSHGPTGGGSMVTIYGSGFHSDATVTIGGLSATEVSVVNANTITAKVPAASAAGAADVAVTNAGDSQTGTYAKGYTYDDGIVATLSKSINTGFSASGSSLTNLSSGITAGVSRFVWQNYTPGSSGSMPNGTYCYEVTVLDEAGLESAASPETAGITVSTGSSTGSVALQWRAIANAYRYRLYRTSSCGSYSSSLVTTLSAADSASQAGYITYIDTQASTSAGAPPGADNTTRGLRLQQGTAPGNSAGFSAGSSTGTAIGAGAQAFKRPDGKYVVIVGGGSTATKLYDPTTNLFSTGPTLPAATGSGALVIQRPDGHFMIASGNGTNTTCLYDPGVFAANCNSDASITTGAGAHAFKRPDGKYVVVAGGASSATYIYDPLGDSIVTGPILSANATSGALTIARPDGKFVTILGGTATMNLYDPGSANSYSTAGMPSITTGAGAHAIQRPDGRFLIVSGGGTTNSSIYDPVANTVTAGPTVSASAGAGAHALQRPDGKYLVILGNNSNATSIYDPTTNTFTAGPTTLFATATTGAFSLQRPDGKYLLMLGGGTTTNIYAAGWNAGSTADGGTVGTFVSEPLHAGDLSSWQKIAWQTAFAADGGQEVASSPNIGDPTPTAPTTNLANWQTVGQNQAVDSDVMVEVKTAINQTGLNSLASATYRTVGNGDSISPATGEVWAQVRITFTRRVPGWTAADHSGQDVWTGEASTFSNRYFAQPTIKSLNLTYAQMSVSSIVPNVGPSGGGTPFTITGSGFEAGSKVTIGGQLATNVFVVNSTTITGVTPGGHTASPQDVTVTNPVSNISQTKSAAFTYNDNYNQKNLSTLSEFTAAGSTLTNVSSDATYHIKMNEGAFQWLSYDSNTGGTIACAAGKSANCTYAGSTSINSGGLASGNYYYRVTALDKDGHESLPGPETGAIVVRGPNGSIQLHWRPVAGAYGYKVYRTTSSGNYTSNPALAGSVTINAGGASTSQSYVNFLDVGTTPAAGTFPTSTDNTNDALYMDRYISIPANATASACPSTTCDGPSVQGGSIGAGAHALKRPDGKFLIILGNNTTTTNIYDPASDTFTTSGAPTLSGSAGSGSHSIERSDGKFLILHGSTSDIYDPVTGAISGGPNLTGSVGAGAFSLPITTDKYIIFLGGSITTTNIYDAATNRIRLGPSSTASIGVGAAAIYRPTSGTYMLLSTSGSNIPIFDPATISFSTATVQATSLAQPLTGSHVVQSPDGRYALIGSSGVSTQVTIIEPNSAGGAVVGGSVTNVAGLLKGNSLPVGVGAGAHAIQRPDGNIVDLQGGGSTGSTIIDTTYDSYTTGPTMRAAISTGAFSIQRPDGKYLVFHGGGLSSTTVLDVGWQTNANLILNNSFETNANDWSADGAATPSQTTGQARYGSAALQVATTAAAGDGVKYGLKLLPSTQYDVSFYGKLSSGTFTTLEAGYAADGSTETACSSMSTNTLVTSGWTRITCTINAGSVSGSPYLYLKQTDATARTFYVDNVSVVRHSTVASYTSPDIQPTDIVQTGGTTWGQISWVKTLDDSLGSSGSVNARIEVKTATDTTGLAAASWVDVASGDTIGSAGQKAMKFRVTFSRDIPGWSTIDHGGADVWTSEGTIFNNRNFAMPTLQSVTAGYVTNSGTYGSLTGNPSALGQFRLDGSTPLAPGEGTSEDVIVFKGTMTSPNASDILNLEVEAEPINTAFTNTPNIIGNGSTCSGCSGVTVSATAYGLAGGSYHWQARVRGISGASGWTAFGGNLDTLTADTDFATAPTNTLLHHGKTFINETLQPLCSTHFCGP